MNKSLIGISTCFRPGYDPKTDRQKYFQLVNPFLNSLSAISETGARYIELSGLPVEFTTGEIEDRLNEMNLKVLSAHNYIDEMLFNPADRYGDDLASPNDIKRNVAVERTIKSAKRLKQLKGKVLVLHPGSITEARGRNEFWKTVSEVISRKASYEDYKNKIMKIRNEFSSYYLESLIKSLETLIDSEKDIVFALECRNYPYELPNASELNLILDEFRGKNISYWHDCGHAFFNELLGFYKQQEILDASEARLIGFHIHDVKVHDHQVPGTGLLDWNFLKTYIERAKYLIIEVAPDTPYNDLKKGFDFTRKLINNGDL